MKTNQNKPLLLLPKNSTNSITMTHTDVNAPSNSASHSNAKYYQKSLRRYAHVQGYSPSDQPAYRHLQRALRQADDRSRSDPYYNLSGQSTYRTEERIVTMNGGSGAARPPLASGESITFKGRVDMTNQRGGASNNPILFVLTLTGLFCIILMGVFEWLNRLIFLVSQTNFFFLSSNFLH